MFINLKANWLNRITIFDHTIFENNLNNCDNQHKQANE